MIDKLEYISKSKSFALAYGAIMALLAYGASPIIPVEYFIMSILGAIWYFVTANKLP